jgi:hypothetical protein
MVREYQDACKWSNCIQRGCKLSSLCTGYAELMELMAYCQLRAAGKVRRHHWNIRVFEKNVPSRHAPSQEYGQDTVIVWDDDD